MKAKKITFPKDEQKHDSTTEWWYYNGHLKDPNGHNYAYMNTLFKIKYPKVFGGFFSYLPSINVYFYHSIITDIDNNKFYPNIELNLKTEDRSNKFLNLSFLSKDKSQGYSISQTEKTKYQIHGKNLSLSMDNTKDPILVGGSGFVDNVGEKTFYYSLSNLESKGKLTVNNTEVPVTGVSWMDHQWGDFGIPRGFWNWFSIQLENDTQIVCYQVGNKRDIHCLATISYEDNRQESFTNVQIIAGQEAWTSPKSRISYPLSWQINIPEANISISTHALVEDHEVDFRFIKYWEGPIEINAKLNGKDIAGSGYQELVGGKPNKL